MNRAEQAEAAWVPFLLDVALYVVVILIVILAIALLRALGKYVALGESFLDDFLEGDDTCEDCSLVLTERNRAITCPVHFLCDDCDTHRVDDCRGCRTARAEASIWCVDVRDPFFDQLADNDTRDTDPPAVQAWLRGGAR